MRILLDSNVLLSIGLFPNDRMLRLLGILKEHTIIMPSYIMDELKSVTERKFPKRKHVTRRITRSSIPQLGKMWTFSLPGIKILRMWT